MNLKKLFSCKCGKAHAFEISSELNLEDVTVSGNCTSCGMAMHITMSAMMGGSAVPSSAGGAESAIEPVEDHGIEQAEYASVGDENVEAAVKNLFG
jgi:hypothetical protein